MSQYVFGQMTLSFVKMTQCLCPANGIVMQIIKAKCQVGCLKCWSHLCNRPNLPFVITNGIVRWLNRYFWLILISNKFYGILLVLELMFVPFLFVKLLFHEDIVYLVYALRLQINSRFYLMLFQFWVYTLPRLLWNSPFSFHTEAPNPNHPLLFLSAIISFTIDR